MPERASPSGKEATNAEIYGSLSYFNGWEAPDRGHGHNIYAQNQTGTKKITDTILFSGFSHNIHIYGSSSAFLNNFDIEGITTFNAGDLSSDGGRVLLLGGDSVAQNPILKNNYLYRLPGGPISDFDMGYNAGCSNANVTNNYISTTTWFVNCLPTSMTGNTFYGSISGFTQGQYPSNTYLSSRPTGVKVFIRPNAYEAGPPTSPSTTGTCSTTSTSTCPASCPRETASRFATPRTSSVRPYSPESTQAATSPCR